LKIRHPLLTKGAGWLAAATLKTLFNTLRLDVRHEDPSVDPRSPDSPPGLYSLWHDSILVPLASKYRSKATHVSALASRHQDGAYLVEFMKHLQIHSIRGSTSHGGIQALRQLIREADHNHIFITPDGPRGPQRKLKDGIIFLASQTGLPVVPSASRCINGWCLRGSWTNLYVPKPFSRCVLLVGKPIPVPANLTKAELEPYRKRVQAEMDRLEWEVQRIDSVPEDTLPVRRAA